MSNIACYLPIDRRLALSSGESLPTQAQGASLMADISGFTPLTAAYAATLGPRQGAEELIAQINRVYTVLIAEVHRYGGSVIYFSGDAITCWFGDDNGLRATACALAMQQGMGAFTAVQTPAGNTVTLTIKVAIAAGWVRRFVLGDPHIMQMDALVGSPLQRMAAAETMAHAEEVIVSEEVVQAVADALQIAAWRSQGSGRFAVIDSLKQPVSTRPWPREQTTPDEAQVRSWLFGPVYARLQSSTDLFLSELRPAFALFVRFSGLDYDADEDVGEKLDAYIRWVQHTVSRYAGYLLQLTTGDKGSYLYAAFGAPTSHEDDADRALLAAQALRQLPPTLSFIKQFQIGVSHGQMRVGPYGSETRRTYGIFGHETNIAARLMSYAQPGQVVVSERVVKGVRKARFTFDPLGPVLLKGNDRAILLYALLPGEGTTAVSRRILPAAQTAAAPLVGRREERARLSHLLQRLLAGESNVALLEGEGGIGKSHIVQALLSEARTTDAHILLGEANAIEEATPYFAWRAVFHTLFQLDAVPKAARQAHVLGQMPSDPALQPLQPLLNAVLPLDLPESELTEQMSGLARANKTHELLTAVLQQAADDAPLLLVLEDVHWLDSASWALAEAVQQSVQPLLLLLVSRPLQRHAAPGERPSPLIEAAAAHHIRLQRLSIEESLALVRRRLGVSALPPPIAAFIADRAEGHPFFSEELAYALRERNVIEVIDGTCRLNVAAHAVQGLDFPTTVEGVVTSRIDRLAPPQQLLLKVSSVIGRTFDYHALHTVHPVPDTRAALPGHLQTLNRMDITMLAAPPPRLAYMFKHVITQQVAYNLLLYAQRRELHREVARWYESTYAYELGSVAPVLAYHWRQALPGSSPEAALAEKAIFYAEMAGDEAVRKHANQEAVRFFKDAQTVADLLDDAALVPRTRRAHWALQLGEAYLGLGQLMEAHEHLERCLALLGWPVADSNGRIVANLLREVGWRVLPKRVLRRTQAQRQTLQEAARAYELLGQVFYLTNQPLPTLYAMLRGLNLAERVGEGTPELARAYANMSGAVALIPLHKQARSFEARAWRTVRHLDDMTALTYVSFIVNVHKINIAAWKDAEHGFAQARELALRLGDRRTAGFCISGMAHIAYYRGYIGLSTTLFEQLAALGEAAQDVTHWGTALGALGAIRLRQGEWQEALAYFEQALPKVVMAGNALAEWNSRVRMGLAQFYLNQFDAMQETIEAATAYATTAPHSSFANTTIYSDVLTLLLLLWEQSPDASADAQEKVGRLLRRYKQYTRIFPFAKAPYWRLRGWASWLNGRSRQAVKQCQRALSAAEQCEMPYEAGMAHYEIGRHLPPQDPQRAHHLTRAVDILQELGATFDAQQAQREVIG